MTTADGMRNDDVMDPVVHGAIQAMREPVAVRPEWRAELIAKLPARRRPRPGVRWASVGIAAMLCLGLGLTALVSREAAQGVASGVASPVRFSIRAPSAARVSLVGDFDRWDPTALPLRRARDGETWTLDVQLPPGRHVFAYAVDGDLKTDPAAPRAVEDDFGVPSSVVVVARGGNQ